jgi:hypothetical protein
LEVLSPHLSEWQETMGPELEAVSRQLQRMAEVARLEGWGISIVAPGVLTSFLEHYYLSSVDNVEPTAEQKSNEDKFYKVFVGMFAAYHQAVIALEHNEQEFQKRSYAEFRKNFTAFYAKLAQENVSARWVSSMRENILLILVSASQVLGDDESAAVYAVLVELEIQKREGKKAYKESVGLVETLSTFEKSQPESVKYARDLVVWQSVVINLLKHPQNEGLVGLNEVSVLLGLLREKEGKGSLDHGARNDLGFFIAEQLIRFTLLFQPKPMLPEVLEALYKALAQQRELYRAMYLDASAQVVDIVTLAVKEKVLDESLITEVGHRLESVNLLIAFMRRQKIKEVVSKDNAESVGAASGAFVLLNANNITRPASPENEVEVGVQATPPG